MKKLPKPETLDDKSMFALLILIIIFSKLFLFSAFISKEFLFQVGQHCLESRTASLAQ